MVIIYKNRWEFFYSILEYLHLYYLFIVSLILVVVTIIIVKQSIINTFKNLIDYFFYGTGAMFFDVAWVEEHQDAVVNYMEKVFGWNQEEKEKYEAEVTEAVKEGN